MLRQGTVSEKNAAIKCAKKVDMNVKPMLETAKKHVVDKCATRSKMCLA